MKKCIFLMLVIISNSGYCMEGPEKSKNPGLSPEIPSQNIKKGPDHIGWFALATYERPMYAGDLSSKQAWDPFVDSAEQLRLNIKPNDLMFKIAAGLKIAVTEDNKVNLRLHQNQAWRKLLLSEWAPYEALQQLDEGDILTWYTMNGDRVDLQVDTQYLALDVHASIKRTMFDLLSKAYQLPNYELEHVEALAEQNILAVQKASNGEAIYFHGRKGFDFNVLDDLEKELAQPQPHFYGYCTVDQLALSLYAGYNDDTSGKVYFKKLRHLCNRDVQPNELIFKLLTSCKLFYSATREENEDLREEWEDLSKPTDMPYAELSKLKEGDSFDYITPRKGQRIRFTMNTQALTKTEGETLEQCLIEALKKVKGYVNFALGDQQKLLDAQIIAETNATGFRKLAHGPKGFNFSGLLPETDENNQEACAEPPVQLKLAE